ncbi:hypothetical protein VTK56DRAFT_9332 [Thermocarpiscus australiensis]
MRTPDSELGPAAGSLARKPSRFLSVQASEHISLVERPSWAARFVSGNVTQNALLSSKSCLVRAVKYDSGR